MRKLIILGAAASLLTLAACNREAEPAAPADETAAAADTASDAAAPGSGPASGSTGGAAAPTDTASPYPANDPMPPASDGPGTVTDATRAGAKEKAEATNLHPKTN